MGLRKFLIGAGGAACAMVAEALGKGSEYGKEIVRVLGGMCVGLGLWGMLTGGRGKAPAQLPSTPPAQQPPGRQQPKPPGTKNVRPERRGNRPNRPGAAKEQQQGQVVQNQLDLGRGRRPRPQRRRPQ